LVRCFTTSFMLGQNGSGKGPLVGIQIIH